MPRGETVEHYKQAAYEAILDGIVTSIQPLLQEGPEIKRRLERLAEEAAHYVTLALAGDKNAETDLDFLKNEARMIASRFALKGQAAAARIAENVIAAVARVAFVALKGALGIPSLPV
ncbi:MAG TPA: hypothetical protein VGK73_03015 [Polyangiaceae bacterium]